MPKNISLMRWIDIFALSITSSMLINIIIQSKWVTQNFNRWAEIATMMPWYFQITLGCIGLYSIYKMLLDLKVIHPKHWENIHLQLKYPPLYFSAALCISELLILGILEYPDNTNFKILSFLIIYLAICIALRNHEKYQKKIPHKNLEDSKNKEIYHKSGFLDYLQRLGDSHLIDFYKWIQKEEPEKIDASNDFGRNFYAARIEEHLLKDKNVSCHIAIIGDFGSGKSSIGKTIRENLSQKGNDYIFAEIDGWGRSENSCAAQILEEIVEELSKYIDCSSIRNVPKQYLDALSGADIKGSKTLAALFQNTQYYKPTDTLEKIDTLLKSIKKRLLVTLEDFDRRTTSKETLEEIAALLDRLRKLENIDFIINSGRNTNSKILSRVISYQEDISDINSESAIRKFFFISEEIEKYKHNLLLSYPLQKRNENFFDINTNLETSEIISISKIINQVIKTPRDLKNILRRSLIILEKLAGEICPEDVLALNCIRYTDPNTFEFICSNINRLKEYSKDPSNDLTKGIISILDGYISKQNHNLPIMDIVHLIFTNHYGSDDQLKFQKLCFHGDSDYFYKFLLEDASSQSDITAFKELRTTYLLENEKTLYTTIEKIADSRFLIEKICQFHFYLSNKSVHHIIPLHLLICISKKIEPIHKNFQKFINDNAHLIRLINELPDINEAIVKNLFMSLWSRKISLEEINYLTHEFKGNASAAMKKSFIDLFIKEIIINNKLSQFFNTYRENILQVSDINTLLTFFEKIESYNDFYQNNFLILLWMSELKKININTFSKIIESYSDKIIDFSNEIKKHSSTGHELYKTAEKLIEIFSK